MNWNISFNNGRILLYRDFEEITISKDNDQIRFSYTEFEDREGIGLYVTNEVEAHIPREMLKKLLETE